MNRSPFWVSGLYVGAFLGVLCFVLFTTTSLNVSAAGIFLQPGYLIINLVASFVPALATSDILYFTLGLASFVLPYILLGIFVGLAFFRKVE